MSSSVLFIFEGKKTEPNIANSLSDFFINEKSNSLLKASYGFGIYQLYKKLKDDPYIELYDIIVEEILKRDKITPSDQEVLNIKDYDNISDIYLFFDYDCHCSNANDEHLASMLEHFDDSQDKGLLCISYPMVEAIRHQLDHSWDPILHSIQNDDLRGYKKWINNEKTLCKTYHNWANYDLKVWKEITETNLARANSLVNDSNSLPSDPLIPSDIFSAQLEKHIPQRQISVLSAFPFMLHDFYGDELYQLLVQ